MSALWVTMVRQAGVPAIRGPDVQFYVGRISESPPERSPVRSGMPMRHAVIQMKSSEDPFVYSNFDRIAGPRRASGNFQSQAISTGRDMSLALYDDILCVYRAL